MEDRPKVVVTWPIDPPALEKLRTQAEVIVNRAEDNLSLEELKALVAGATAILCLLTDKITAEIFEAAGPHLKIVASMSVGMDHIDLAAAQTRGVIVTNTPGVLDNAVAEHTIALILALAKSLPAADQFVRSGQFKGWEPNLFVGPELAGKKLGIIGLGRIGSTVAKIAGAGLAMTVIYYDIKPNPAFEAEHHARYCDVDELLGQADFVSLHLPLLPTTRHFIDGARLAKMKPSGYLINTARGPIVDEAALVSALQAKQIAGAGLDVYENEPQLAPGLTDLPNVLLTPHSASATLEARQAMAEQAADNILAVLAGQLPPNPVKAQ